MIQNAKGSRHVARARPCYQRGTLVGDGGGQTGCGRRRAARNLSGHGLTRGIGKRVAAIDQMVDDVRLEGIARFQETAVKNKLHRCFRSHPFPGAHRPAITGKKTEIDLGKAELAGRIVNGNDGVECQRKFYRNC